MIELTPYTSPSVGNNGEMASRPPTELAALPGAIQDRLANGISDGKTFPYEAAQSFDAGTVVETGVTNNPWQEIS
jgi:hypothetical protein